MSTSPPLLFSTNCYLKYFIQVSFRRSIHYVWCSEAFDARKKDHYMPVASTAASSNPADIYRELKRAVESGDKHCSKIKEQKASFLRLAVEWEQQNEITRDEREEIAYIVENATHKEWRPILYVIPRILVKDRLQIVAPSKRASIGREFIVPDLKTSEFELVEL